MYRVLRMRLRKLSKQEYLILERLTYHAKSAWNNTLYAYKNELLPDLDLSRQSKLYRYVKRNNQNFVSLPHGRFVEILKHKAQITGIEIKVVSEGYISKIDALALESIMKHEKYLGKRKRRGLFISSIGVGINADVNGAINIARKAFGDSCWKSNPECLKDIGDKGRPLRIRVV